MTTLPTAHVIEADGRTLTIGQLRLLMDKLPAEAHVMVDGNDVKVATDYAGILYMDTGKGLPMPCTVCGFYGCMCHAHIEDEQ